MVWSTDELNSLSPLSPILTLGRGRFQSELDDSDWDLPRSSDKILGPESCQKELPKTSEQDHGSSKFAPFNLALQNIIPSLPDVRT